MAGFRGKVEAPQQLKIVNNGFFPDLELGDLQTLYTVPTSYNAAMVEAELCHCVIEINTELAEEQRQWQSQGANTLAEVKQTQVQKKGALVRAYEHAVYCLCKSRLAHHFAGHGKSAGLDPDAEQTEYTANYWASLSRRCLASLSTDEDDPSDWFVAVV